MEAEYNEQVIPKGHFFRKLNELLDWRKYTRKMMRWHKGGAEYGRPPFDPVVLLKMLLVAWGAAATVDLIGMKSRHCWQPWP